MNIVLNSALFQEGYDLSPEILGKCLTSFQDASRAAADLTRLAEDNNLQQSGREFLRTLIERLPASPDPDEVLNNVNRMLSSQADRTRFLEAFENHPQASDRLSAVAGQGPFLTEIAIRQPEALLAILESETLDRFKRWPQSKSEIDALFEPCPDLDRESVAQQLRRYRSREMLRIAIRDVLELGGIEECSLELSHLADNVIARLCQQLQTEYRDRFGRPLTEEQREAQFIVIALGKLGGRELNFSSDVDLIFVYEGEGRPEKQPEWDNFEYFSKLAADLVNLLSISTDEGHLYRVDTRLRPEGSRGALVRSLPSLELYYESWGESWERQAMLKARPVAGDEPLGRRFLRTIQPFTFRKYVDPVSTHETLRAMSEMRSKTAQAHHSTVRGEGANVKTGPGGIRDVEFVVQAVQMLYGGQYPEIRCAGTFDSLSRMRESGLLRAGDFASLYNGYCFLRRVEHRLQMEQGLQVYTLPANKKALSVFAKRLGYENAKPFFKDFRESTSKIHEIFNGIFAPFATTDLLEALMNEQEGQQLLRSHHLSDPKKARAVLQALAKDPETPHLNPKVRRLFRRILPRLMEKVKESPVSELALSSFERIVSAMGARSALYTTLAGNPQLVELLVSLGSQSRTLTDTLVRFPDQLDWLVDPAFLSESLNLETLQTNHASLRDALRDADPIDVLRRLKRTQVLKIGLRYLLRLSDVTQTTRDLSSLAEYILECLLRDCSGKHESKFGRPRLPSSEPCRMAIVGMGKLGGGELGFGSDLDLLFVYEDSRGDVVPAGPESRRMDVKEYFVRLAAAVLKRLATNTQEGWLFKADVRLRPYGKGGDLAGSLQQYHDYYQREAALWERQALTRARFIAGDPEVGRRFLLRASEFVYSLGLSASDKAQIAHLRRRIERERKGQEIKSGEGGLVDVEFLVQTLQLVHGREHPSVQRPHTLEALNALKNERLIDPAEAKRLSANYLFLRDISNRLHIMDGISISRLPKDSEALDQLVRRMYHLSDEPTPTSEQFLDRYDQCRKEIRAIFDRHFQSED